MSSVLKEARLKAGLKIQDVARDLRVRHQYLVAIEEEDFAILPGKAYVNGYRRMYAKYLGVDLSELAPAPNQPERLWARPERLSKYNSYKVVLLLSLLGFVILTLWYGFADKSDHEQNRNLSDSLLNKSFNFHNQPVTPFVKEYKLNNIE